MELLQEALSLARGITEKISPGINWIAEKIASYIDVEVVNVHMILVFLLAGWVAKFIAGRGEAFTLKHIIITVLIFLGLKYVGL